MDTQRVTVPEAEVILGKTFPVLDHGFVRLVDYMGSDASIVQAARVSYGEGTKTAREDQGLINYLMENRHTSPFEMVEMKFHCKMPIFVARQWVRHRTASINEYSGRYSEMKPEFYMPDDSVIKQQSTDNKQGRSNEMVPTEISQAALAMWKDKSSNTFANYRWMLEHGIARELARVGLPLSLYTEWYWKIDLHNLLHFLGLRLDSHAQYEIRQYAGVMAGMVEAVAPMTWGAFKEFRLNAVTFSATEIKALKAMLQEETFQFPKDPKGRRHAKFLDKITKM